MNEVVRDTEVSRDREKRSNSPGAERGAVCEVNTKLEKFSYCGERGCSRHTGVW